jgi:hypothetical protein
MQLDKPFCIRFIATAEPHWQEQHRSGGSTQGIMSLHPSPLRLRAFPNKASLRIGSRLVGAIVAMVLLWCDGALAAGPHVILLRGWFGVFSSGLDNLAQQLRAQGVEAKVAGHLNWSTEVAEILRERSAGQIRPLVLVGHSQGANNVIDMARLLESQHVTVDLLVTLSPFLQNPIPANVAKAINYYQAPGWGQPIAPDRGFHGKIVNFDLSGDQTITHISIDKSARVQAEILQEITALNKSVANIAPTTTVGGAAAGR